MAQSAHGDLHIMNNELMTSWVYNNVIGLWYHMGYLFRNGFVCIVRRCKLLNPENISGYHQIDKIGELLQFSSKRKGIRAWNFRMMIRKIWRFLWYQNRNNFEKNEKRKDQAPLTGGNWQKWKRVFLTCPCHEIYRDEAVGLKSCKNTWKLRYLWKCEIWGNIVKIWYFVNNCLIKAWI